jgi:amino acid transporter
MRPALAATAKQSYWLPAIGTARQKVCTKFILFSAAPYKPRKPTRLAHLHTSILSPFSIMGNLLYIIAVILIIIWALGFFGILGAGIAGNSLIHILLVIAIIAILLRVISGRNPV